MAEIKWTPAQEQAICEKDKDILVSAAAGSGKTAVLVDRVIKKLTDPKEAVGLDSLLIMTFTKAAAAQMKEKIYRSLKEAVKNSPGDENLRRQLYSVSAARIMTIDSLCLDIVKENFQEVDIDPLFRLADDAESSMLKADVLKEVIEEHYADPTPDFLELVNFYIDKSDAKLEEIILDMYRFSQSHPEPDLWITASISPYLEAAGYSEGTGNPWLKYFAGYIDIELLSIRERAEQGLKIALENYGPYKYEELFREIIEFIDSVMGSDGMLDNRRYDIQDFLARWPYAPRFGKNDEVDGELKNAALDIRKNIKTSLEGLMEKYLISDLAGIYEDMAGCARAAQVIASLTMEFEHRLFAAKKERRVLDFNDVAHLALKVLIRHDREGNLLKNSSGEYIYSETADLMASELNEIILDEYQDTNRLQECIIQALSGRRRGRPDVFMVGDVKQSIYGFRLACPELFNDKFHEYAKGENAQKRIILSHNFRSRREVIGFTNLIFGQVMTSENGGTDYLDNNELNYGADFPETPADVTPELLFIAGGGDEAKTAEGYLIAGKIRELSENFRYRDMVILTRNTNNPELEKTLEAEGIPVIKNSGKGFFDSLEIRYMLNILNIIDNPYQDIPFTAVLTGPLLNLKANDLAALKNNFRREFPDKIFSVYEACAFSNMPVIKNFLDVLEELRDMASYMGVCELLEQVIGRLSLDVIFTAMPDGEARAANIELLKAKAESFAEGSYSGLFNFIRYIKEMRKADIDFGKAQSPEGDTDAVRLMTVHKSKGLEFPVVILAGCGKKYNETDIRSNIVMDEELGLGLELRDPKERMVRRTAIMETIRTKKKLSLYAEEMRLLYVALTRAKEKLIITGAERSLEKLSESWRQECFNDNRTIGRYSFLKANSFLKLTGLALTRKNTEGQSLFKMSFRDIEELRAEQVEELVKTSDKRVQAEAFAAKAAASEDFSKRLYFEYPFERAVKMPVKITASQLEKKEEFIRGGEYADGLQGKKGAERGTLYHTYFENIDYARVEPGAELSELEKTAEMFAAELINSGKFSKEQAGVIEPGKIAGFFKSDICCRMKKAALAGLLRREQQFVMKWGEEGQIMQGIIDAFFEENGRMVLVDYKTDRGRTEKELSEMYRPQQEAYAKAIEAACGLKVSEKILYSTELNREIRL